MFKENNLKEYYVIMNDLKKFNDYLTACICPIMYARNNNLRLFPNYSHNHGAFLYLADRWQSSSYDFNIWHSINLAKNYIYAFSIFRNLNYTNLIQDVIGNEPNQKPTDDEKKLFDALFFGGIYNDEIIDLFVLPAITKILLYKEEKLWGRHYMEVLHPEDKKFYPSLIIPPTAKGHVQIDEVTNDLFWSIEIDSNPFTWSMITIPFDMPVGYIPLSKIKQATYKSPEIYKRDHLVVKSKSIPLNEWFFTYEKNLDNFSLKIFEGGVLEINFAIRFYEIIKKMIAMIAAMKQFKVVNPNCFVIY